MTVVPHAPWFSWLDPSSGGGWTGKYIKRRNRKYLLLSHGTIFNTVLFQQLFHTVYVWVRVKWSREDCEDNSPLTLGSWGCQSALKKRGPIFSDSPPTSRRRTERGKRISVCSSKLSHGLECKGVCEKINCGRAGKKRNDLNEREES